MLATKSTASVTAVWRKRLSVLLNIALLLAVTLTFFSGFVGAALDLNRFAYHKYAAYLAIALALAHVVLHWRALSGQVRRWLVPGPVPPRIRQQSAAPLAQPGRSQRFSRRALLWPPVLFVAGAGLGRWLGHRAAQPGLEEGEDLGQVYHDWSSTSYAGLLSKSLRVGLQPSPYKEYPGVPLLPLPPPPEPSGPPLEVAIEKRRSVRDYAARPLSLEEVSRLLHYTAGITDTRDPTLAFRAAPSSGALYPIETYPVIFNVRDVPAGVYHYSVRAHALEQLKSGDYRQDAFRAALTQEMVLGASLVLVFTGMFSRVEWKYVDRSYRYMLLEAGHLGENLYLTATALGLGACGMGAFFDDQVNQLIGADGKDEAALYLMALGPR